MAMPDPFHAGELAVQQRAGEAEIAALNSRMISPTIPVGAIPFIARQPWVILGGLGEGGDLWATALGGDPGFACADAAGQHLRIALPATARPDPLLSHLHAGQPLGTLFLDPSTRKRLRVNGHVDEAGPEHLDLAVAEAFPNCPKFIQKRVPVERPSMEDPVQPGEGTVLDPGALALLRHADTAFLATLHPERGIDVSHRGGPPGFLEVRDGRTLRWPDYPGNSLFQSFGNLAVDDRLALVVPDFRSGALLHLTGRGQVVWDQPDPGSRSGGTGRFVVLSLERWIRGVPLGARLRWTEAEPSPFLP